MPETKRRLVESPNGIGKVYRGDAFVADVRYSLNVEQTMHISRTYGGTEEIPGLTDIRGVITVTTGEKNLSDASVLTLHLSDGRRWDFFAKSGNRVSGQYSVVNSSGQGIVRP